MKITDLTGLSKPLTRLIEVVAKGVGAVSAPYLLRKTADARAHEIRVIASALDDVREQNHLPVTYKKGAIEVWQKPDDGTLVLDNRAFEQRVAGRLDYQERKRQDNIERITTAAAAELSTATSIPDAAPDDDWITRFFNGAQDVSSQEMQELWGKILAGEIKKPASYSLRTLDFVRNLTVAEARILEKVGRLALTVDEKLFFVCVHDLNWLQKERDIHHSDHLLLSELGMMHPTELDYNLRMKPENSGLMIFGTDHLLHIQTGGSSLAVDLPIWKFTQIGQELMPLILRPFDETYMVSVGKYILRFQGRPTLGKIISRQDGGLEYKILKEIVADQPQPEVVK